ncbi:hypothetical protein JG687_00015761 [Phytophthora cactorum]|uniref:HAT C-terminal dimerisation domain-containing protein n=1 Tax=Phytophthora cactorum TaxID=29920 RepID=A0A8T1TXV4_9STRA|nr:hypothetical protein JG687_00015761 [Phytophthora cactorum]
MMARRLVLREFISAEDEELAEEMPSTATNRNLKALLGQLADAQSVAMELLCAELNLLDARDLLNGLLEVMPSFGDYLAPNAEIVHAPDFESGVVKVLGAQAKRLTCTERSSLQPFLRRAPPPVRQEEPVKVGFADRILKRRKVDDVPSAYILLGAIPPTSNIFERLFSMARMVLRYERNRLSLLTLEMILFRKVNQKYWDVTTVDGCI